MVTVTFDCGHKVVLPATVDPTWPKERIKFWQDQSVPRLPGAVALCPGCISSVRWRGEHRQVVSVQNADAAGTSGVPEQDKHHGRVVVQLDMMTMTSVPPVR